MEIIRKNILPLMIGGLGLIFITIGIFQVILDSKSESSLEFQPASETRKSETKIMIDIQGAVIRPGVHELSSEKRLVDALGLAGGLSVDADREYVSKHLNLSSKLSDGLKIYIPRTGESVTSADESVNSSNSILNINSAPITELDKLPGIGLVSAEKIIEGRPYSGIEDLLNKKIVGAKTYESIKDLISAD